MAEWLSTGAFARRAGVTVRTVRYYDSLGLLRPAHRISDGRRRYGVRELVRLQQILTLKFLGFSLADIGRILDAPSFSLEHALETQRAQVADRIDKLREVLCTIDRAQQALVDNGADWETFAAIIQAIQMENEYEAWATRYYTAEQLERFKARQWTAADQERAGAEWADILGEARRLAAEGADPDGDEAQTLAARYQGMIDAFTQGDPEIEARLNRMYADRDRMPEEMRRSFDPTTSAFIGAMLGAYKARRGR